MKNDLLIQQGQPSWRIATKEVEAFVTETGGHLAPVTFALNGKNIQPFSVAPWAEEKIDDSFPPLLKSLRGDFFCLPFGGNGKTWKGEQHPPHGETANSKWHLESQDANKLHLSLQTKVREGRVDKYICTQPGHSAIYQRHLISGMSGPMNPGHHATLKFPDEPGSGRISTSPIREGQVLPEPFELPENRGYSSLLTGSKFKSLNKVKLQNGSETDLSIYPARRGFEDLVMLESDTRPHFAWTAVTFPKQGCVWFALKDPKVLRQTVMWISNGGRHYAPWSGRHVNVLGLEEVTSFFHLGLAESVSKNSHSSRGLTTHLKLSPKKPLAVNYIIGMAPIPRGFDCVASITAAKNGESVELISRNKKKIQTPLNLSWLFGNTAP